MMLIIFIRISVNKEWLKLHIFKDMIKFLGYGSLKLTISYEYKNKKNVKASFLNLATFIKIRLYQCKNTYLKLNLLFCYF